MRRAGHQKKRVKVGVKRPIDKRIVVCNSGLIIGTAQTNSNLYPSGLIGAGATFPGTITGLRWKFEIASNNTSPQTIFWAIVKLREGVAAPSTIGTSDNNSLYNPEQDVMTCGTINIGSGGGSATSFLSSINVSEGFTKTMRKLMAGDRLVVCYASDTAGAAGVGYFFSGFVEFFFKS